MFGKLNKLVFRADVLNKNFSFSVQQEKEFLDSLPEAKDLFQRSYNQYLSQRFLLNQSLQKRLILNIGSVIFLPFYLTLEIVKGFFLKNGSKASVREVAVFPYKGKYGQIIPQKLLNQFEVIEIPFGSGSGISIDNFKFIAQVILKFWRSPLFVFKCIYKISFYNFIIKTNNCKVIIGSNEYSYASSILTAFCNCQNVLHYNVMHGEKLFSIMDSWFKFDKFFVWDSHYSDLFVSLKAEPNQFEVQIPENLEMKIDHTMEKRYFLTYYLAGEGEELMLKIKENLDKLRNKPICIRYHPRYNDPKKIQTIFGEYFIEDPMETTLKESFERTKFVSSLFSTILFQGYLNGMDVVIDNASHSKEEIEELRDKKFILLHKDVEFLSNLL